MSEKPRKSSLGRAGVLAGAAAGALATACGVPTPTQPGESDQEVVVDLGRRAADAEREAVGLEGWRGVLMYEGAPLVYLDGVRMVPERLADMPEPVRSFLQDPVWDPRIEHVEVVRREHAIMLYGPGAAGGVVHVFTNDPNEIGPAHPYRRGAERSADEPPGLRGAPTDTLLLASRTARTLEERQTVIRDAEFLADPPIVFIDGVRVDPGGPEVFELRDPDRWPDIERVKVIKGRHVPCMLFGEDANGILVIFTKGGPDLGDMEVLLGEDRTLTKGERERRRERCSGI